MPNKVTYTITTADGKEHQVSKENVDKYGIQSYADAYKDATIRMRDAQKGDYDIPLQHFDNARKQGLHAFSLEHTPVQKQAAPKPTPTPTAKPTPSPSVNPRQSTPQGSKPLLSDSFGKGTGTDFLKPKPVGYNLSEEHRNEVLGEQAKRSATPSNPHVQHAVQLGNEAKTKRVEREQKRFGKPTIAKAFDDAVHGDKKAAKELGMPQVMQQKKDEIDYMQATGKELRNPVDAGLTYDESGNVVHSMFAPTVARDEHGNIVTNDAGKPLVGVSTDEARAKAYGDSVQTGIEAQREKDKIDNLYKDAVENVNNAFDEDYKKKEAFKKEHPFLGAVSDALEGFSNRGNALQYVPEEAKAGLSTLGMLSKAAVAKNNADRYGDAGTLSRLYGGIMAGLTDPSTYDFGITDTFNATNLYRAAKNYDEGKATNKDKMLLDAAAIANSVQSEASDKLGGAFGAGQNLVGTLGFMAQMATNPASGVGKEAAASVAKTVAKRALQKFGKGAIAKAVTGLAKGATRVGMDAVEAGVVTGMYSPTKIVGDYLNRKTGDVQSDGKGGYIFQNKEYSDVKALAKAINGQYAENISEMWGEYLPGMGKVNAAISRSARKIGLGKVVDAFEHMSSSNWAKTWKNFQERTKWNGMAGEYFEEVANNLYNAVTNGDMTLDTDPHTGVFNPKINLDTFYSVALMSGIMSGVNTAGYARERYKAPHEQHKADAQARSVFGERWDEYKNAIDNADEKQIGSVMEKIGSDKSLSNSQKIAALQYQYRTAVVHGVNAQDTKNKLEGQFNAMDEAYSMGYNLQDEMELNNTAILYDEAKKQAIKTTGWDEDALDRMIGEDGGASTLAYMKRSDEFNDDQLQAFTDYANARSAYNGMIQRVKDDIDTKVHESNLEVDQRTNLDTGAIHPATMKVDNRQVYIVNGNVVMLPDGSGVDHEHSDDFVVLRDANTGELETADPSAIFKVDTPINVQEEKEAAADNIRQTVAQQQADKIDGKLEFKQGDTYPVIDKEDGTQHSLTIIGDAIDEKTEQVNPDMVLVDIDGAQQPILLPKEQVQQQVDEARRAAVAATQVVENAPTTNTNNTYSINDEVTLSDENGNTVRGSITAPQNEDGKFEVYTEQPINGKKVNLFSAEELDTMTKAPTDVAENTTTQQPQQQEETEESVEKETLKQQPTALERIPKDESGQPLYEQAEPETAWDAIVEQTEGDTSMAQTVADDMVSDLEAGVKKAEKTKTKSGGSIAEKIAAEKERAAVIEQAKATLAHWRKIAAVNRMREAAIQAEEQRKADEVARVRKEQEEKERVEQEEAERIKREALNGVPDFVEDKATDARARGYRRVNGDKVDRQEPINATKGKEVQVKFDDDNIPTGHVAIIEANLLQPSHKNGQRNPQHFIDEAQPKERKDDASVGAARKIAANIRPEEITSSVTAYTGAPTVNNRGEVIQGNNRSAALREMWDNHQEQGDKYKQYLIDNAESFGLKPEDVAAMDKPVLVNMLNVNDDEAISLGQFVASDTESGGTERIKPKNVVKKLGDKMKNFTNILLRANDENISFAELVDSNGVNALKWLNANGVISPTQYKSAFDSKGNITAEAKNDIKGIMYQSIFEGGNTQLEEMFNALPAKAQKAILATAYRDYDSPQSERMIEDIQDSIMAYYALSHDSMFMNAKNHKDARIAVEAWRRQLAFDDVTGESYLPAEKYSNFALLLATMYKGDNQSLIQGTFNKMYDLIQGTQEETLFEQPDNTPRSLAQAIKETLNIEYNGQQGSNVLAGDNSASQEGRTGSNGDTTPRGRSENIDGAEANQGGTEGDTGRSGSGQSSGGSQEEVAAVNSHLTKKEAADFIAQMELGADVAQEIPLTIENWDKEFGEDGIVSTPIGDVKMGENQFAKLMRAGRNGKLGMLKPTLEYPDAIVEENSKAKEGTHTERPSSFIFIKSFRKSDGTRYYYFTSITVSVDGKEVVVSNQEKSRNRILRLLMEGSVIWRTPKDATTSSAEKQGLDYVHPDKAEGETKGSVITPQNTPSVGKDKQSSATKQEKTENFVPSPKNSEEIEEEIKYAQEALDELKEYQKRTDTTGRTSVDENGFDSEDLYIPLLLDGKSSRLGVLMSIPDRITNPSGPVATYDFSNDEGNTDWQKWDDLAEEYNKDVGSEERAYTNGDVPILRFKSVDAAVRFADWHNSKSTIEHNNNSSDEDLFTMAERVAEEDKAKRTRKKEEAKVDTNPTEAQKEAGNYKKGHIKLDGFNVTIEQPKGSVRRGKDANGKEWKTEMHNTYGYIRGTESVDGDHIDIFLSDNPTEGNVFVVDQVNKDGSFDEHKIMYGFSDMESARKAYLSNYEEGWQGLGNITEVSKEEFKKWIDSSKRKTKPFAEYKSVRPEMGVGFDTEHAQSSDNYAQNSEKVRKAINAYEDAQEKFDNLFSLLVKEKESKPFDTREWREVNRTKEELKDVLLQLNTKELGELLKQVSGKDTENVIKNVLDIVNREEHRLIAFNAILDKQSYITPEYKEGEKAIPVSEFVETDKKRAEIYTILTGVFHDKGYVVGTDAYLLLARKEDYDKSLEGKVTNKKGEVINGKYPNWRAVVNSGKQGKSWGVNLEELHAFTRGVLTKLKTEKANPSTKKNAKIAFKTADGKIVLCYANALDKALQGAKSIGAKSFFDKDDVFAITQTPKGYVICPMLNQDQNIDDNSFAYVPRVSELQHSTETLSNDTEAKQLATDTILSALNKAGIEVVRATNEQAQELLANTHATSLRTPQGTIYGWAVDGKIYLTEAGINPDTPIHEYTHLWAEAMKTKNKKGWNSIKALLKETPVWNEVVVDPNYSNIMNNEDAVASEVLSRISGRENAARMESEAQKVIDEDKDVFEKAKSVTLLNRIKRALDMFWKWVGKELFKIKKFGSINEVTDRVLYDLMHSTKLNSNDKSLIGVHNISEQKLRKVLKQGGFANPSIAVIDTDKQVHNDYGEISLILPSRKINKSTGKNAGTFEGDAWTPMYPVVEKQISSDGRITMHNDINAVPKDMQSEVRNALNRWLENGSDTDLSYLYLFQQGKAPQMIVEKPKYSNEVYKTLNDIMFGVNSVYNLSKNEIKKLVELYIQTELDGNIKEYNEAIQRKISKYEELIKRGKPNSLQYRVADSYLEDIEKYGYPLSPLINFVNDVQRDKIKQGSKNAQKTLNTASQIIKDAGLEKDFKNWVEGLNNRYQTKEVIFDGFTPTGKRRYIPNTLENVSKIMKKQGRQASAGISISFSNFAAAVMKANGSLDNIRKKKSKLTNEHKDIEDFEEKWKEVYFDLAMKLQPNANMFDDYGFARLQEAANEKNPQTYIRNVYGITLSEEDVQKLQDLVEAIREERPALYFETKFERPVILNEFSKAVVPEDLSDDLKKTLRDNGVEVFTYKRGDVEDRQRVTKQAAYSSNDIAFQVINNSRDGNNTDRFTDGLNAVNEQFNRELAGLTEENADTKIFNLGSPSSILLSAGVEDKPMKLYGNKIIKKMKKHGFALAELQDLPRAVANPIAVFNNYRREGNRTILTELRSQGKNIMVAITLGKNGVDVDFNIVSSVFGKRESNVVDWINKGYLTYINKEKALNYLYFSERGISKAADNVGQEDSNNLYLSAPIAEAAENPELSSAAKIVKDFVNPVIQDENLLRDDTDTLSNIEYEDGNFSELTAEEPLVNTSSSIRSFIEGNLFSEVDFSDSPNKNVNQAISKLTDDELLKEIAKGDSKEWNFYMEEYDRRHNKEFQEAVERYMNSLEDEKTSLDTAYGSYVNVAKNWSNGGYHTTERTLLRAQLDAIEDYVSRKESEQLSSVESEAYHQAKETVRKVGYDLTRLRLRPLEEGEACHVERRYTESNGFSFTGKEHIESIEDIAYIFKQLETSSVENSFLVLIKDGTPTVLHLSIGSYATALAPIEQAIVAADAINPDKVLFVHNHPSGNISASRQDMDVQKKMKEIFGGKVMPAIIINTTSGKFGMFSEDGRLEDGNIPLPDEHNNIPINVYQFSQQVFAKDWNPEFAFRAVSPESIAEYVSSHRLGEHKKMSLIILDQAGHVTGNVFLPWTKLTDVDSHKNIMQIISYVNQMGGRSAILYGNYELGEDTRDTNKSIFKIKTAFSNSALHLMDVINIDDSALDRGAMEEDVEYGKRNLDEEKYREGYGSYTNSELSFINDPVAKMLGKSNRTEEDHKAFAERERQRMISRISELADRLHLDNIETVTDSNSLQGKKAKAKGFYSKSSGKITIVIPNHASVEDVEKTLLHEAVAHYGLRKLFGEHFEAFLDNVYQNVEPEIRRIITSQAANNNWDFRTATEEYLAGLAERTDFERVHYAIWNKIKSLFLKMLHSIGFEGWSATELSDNELRYLLWRSYENMKEPGRYRSILGEAEDIAKQNELKVGNYNQQDTNSSNVAERGILYREDDSKEKERVNAREQYEQRVNRAMFQTQEALQDSMLGLKEAMNAITKAEGKNVNIEDIDGYENAYLGENRLSSVNKAEADAFAHLLFKPMLAEVSKLCKNAQERAELVDYMMAKHGLERNAVMRKRAIEDILNNEKLSDAQKSARAGLAEYRDYAGLTALTGKDNVTEAEVDAETMVSEYENTHDTTNLWDKVNAVNAAILSKSYECGMMDKDTYEKISDMYKYYIPLRGFDETTSEEAYAYLLHQSSAFNAPIKVAKGRSSKADDPFANMQSMAESAITQGNRNKLVKQRFFNFVLNHPSDLVSISDMWLKYDDVADEWKPVFPDNFEENDSAEDIEQKLKEFEDKMKKLAEQAPDKYKHGKETTNIPYRVVDSRDLRQHQVLVKRGGRDYILTLNGNPRAAQALNGQTNPDNDTSGAIGAILKAGEMVNRQLSAFYTTRNPDFVVSNFIRDMLFSNSIVWVKESPNYALRFHRNIARCNPAQIKVLLAKHRKGTLDMNNKLEHMFYQFMMNGGETGYANVRDIEQHKNDIRRELKRANGKLSITKAFNLLGEKLDEYNRAVENCARFAAYLTSREMGRTVERSIYDAKEISVNFNKKGSGAKFMNAVGQTKIGTASAFVSGIGRSGFVFWNAAIQGTTNFGRQFKKHPAKAFTASAIMFLLGAVIAGIGMGDGDDDADANSYWNLPEYVRRSNILFKIGDQWVSIPLPVEYRAIYGMGELMVSAMSGKEHFTGSELGKAIAGQATQVLPIDFLEGGGGVKAFVPSAVKPFAEVYSNKGWTGMPIYKDTPYNKYMPEWTKAYKSANKYLVGIAKTLNESTGGDAYTKGSVDINPAQIEYLLNGYFGGVSGTIDKLSKSAETIAGDREYDPRNFLLLNRILKNGDERTEARAINNEYMRVKEEHDVLKARMKHYENDTDKGLFDYADKIDFLYNSPEFARYEIFEDYSKDIDALYQELKEANDGAEHLSIEKELTELKKEMIEEMNKTRK